MQYIKGRMRYYSCIERERERENLGNVQGGYSSPIAIFLQRKVFFSVCLCVIFFSPLSSFPMKKLYSLSPLFFGFVASLYFRQSFYLFVQVDTEFSQLHSSLEEETTTSFFWYQCLQLIHNSVCVILNKLLVINSGDRLVILICN